MNSIEEIILQSGAHTSPNEGMCVMEAVAYFAGEPFSDHPDCVCPVIGAFLRSWNDGVDDAFRQRLKPYIPRVVGTADAHAEERSWLAMDWIIREYLPTWLELAKITATATALRNSPPILGPTALANVTGLLANSQKEAAAARAAARDAAWVAARVAAWAAAWDAARAAAWDAAWAATQAAAWDAAWDAAWAAAWVAARVAAWDAAWAAAWVAAWAAAWDALKPSVEKLQESAFGLLDRMIAVGANERRAA
jgi:hypothetical protein